jgi:hypothetical protein
MENWWNDTGREKPQHWEQRLSQYHSVHHKSQVTWPWIELGSLWEDAGDYTG